MKKKLYAVLLALFAGLATQAQSPRVCLFEEFTGETCPPCAATNPGLNTLLASPTNTPKVVAIKWQVPIPSAPSNTWSLYKTNQAEIDWRYANYGYGINSAPNGRMDGQHLTVFGAASDHPTYMTNTIIATAQSYSSAFNISMTRAWATGCTAVNLTITVQATANFSATGNLVFRTVMVERLIQFSVQPGTNGETTFEDVGIKSFPSIQSGVALPANWTNGQSMTFTLNCPIPSYTRSKAQVAFVGFIQDDGNMKVAQAMRTATDVVPTVSLAALGASVNATCNNVITPKVEIRNDGPNAISSLTVTPFTDGSQGAVTVWNGNLAAGASTILTLNPVTTATTLGQHTFSFSMTMTAPQYNLTKSINSITYMVASAFQGSPVAEGFVSTSFPPAGWASVNADGGPSWTRNTYAGGYNLTSQCTKYDFYANTNMGDKDELYLPPMDFSGSATPSISMDLAYAQRNANSNDLLEVFASSDCGANWTNVFSQGGTALATFTSYVIQSYLPDQSDPSHWKTEMAALTGFANKPNVLVKFVVTNSHGNNLYIDNVNLSQSALPSGLSANAANAAGFAVFPNPAGEIANVRLESADFGKARVTVMNGIGQLVWERQTELHPGATVLRVDTRGFAPGVYSVAVERDGKTSVGKFVVAK